LDKKISWIGVTFIFKKQTNSGKLKYKMKKTALSFLLIILCVAGYPQILFEKGYFINTHGDKIECLIKNVDWKNNPARFDYKFSEESEIHAAGIQAIKEFGIENSSKYMRSVVKIDRSSEDLSELSMVKNPVFEEDTVFLKVLVEGRASLFIYEEKKLTRFFYETGDTLISPLVYKLYTTNQHDIFYNYNYRQQLFTDLKCRDLSENDFFSLGYSENELVRLFTKYNQCLDAGFTNYDEKRRDFFNLNIRPGLSLSKLTVDSYSTYQDVDFDVEPTFRAGVEGEFILPFNKNKWSVFIEPTYQYYKSEKDLEKYHVIVHYESIEIPIGGRYYFFLGKKSKIFVDAAYVLDFAFNSTLNYEDIWQTELRSLGNFAFGAGYKFHDRLSLELRYQAKREVILNSSGWMTNYRTLSLIFGVTIF
jgi:hypothetical protein